MRHPYRLEVRRDSDGILRAVKVPEPTRAELLAENQRLREDHDALLGDAVTLMDQHASAEVQMEARRRIIEREALAGDAE